MYSNLIKSSISLQYIMQEKTQPKGDCQLNKKEQKCQEILQLYCKQNNKAVFCCATYECQQNAIMCSNQECPCFQKHQCHKRCEMVLLKSLIKSFGQKKKQMPQQILSGFNKLLKIYDDAIQKLSIDREKIAFQKQNNGLCSQQATCLFYLCSKNVQLLTGKLVHQANKQFSIDKIMVGFNQNWVKQVWNKHQTSFNNMLKSFNRIVQKDVFASKVQNFQWNQQMNAGKFNLFQQKLIINSNATNKFALIGYKITTKIASCSLRVLCSESKVGMCLSSWITQEKNECLIFKPRQKHRSYLFGSDSTTYSYSNEGSNGVSQGNFNFNVYIQKFSIRAYDVISLKYLAQDNKLIFTNQSTKQTFHLDVIKPPQNDQYVFCVQLPPRGATQLIPILQ